METVPSVVADVSGLLEDTGGTLVVDGDLSIDSVDVGPLKFEADSPARYYITLTNAGSGILAQGDVILDAKTPCSRCLTLSIERFWVTDEDAWEDDEGLDLEPLEGTTVDLGPAIYASLAAEAPWVPIHSEDCRGLCGICGGDLNKETCDCEPARTDSPFSGLEGLFGEGSDESSD